MSEFVCLKCWNVFQGRKTDATGRACSRCNSRYIHEFSQLVTMFQVLKDRIQGCGKLAIDNQFIDDYVENPINGDIFLAMNFAQGHKRLWMFIRMAIAWDERKMTAEEFLILKFRTLSKEFIKEAPKPSPPVIIEKNGKQYPAWEQGPRDGPTPADAATRVMLKQEDAVITQLYKDGAVDAPPVVVSHPTSLTTEDVKALNTPIPARKPASTKAPNHAWECQNCHGMNAAKHEECRSCGKPYRKTAPRKEKTATRARPVNKKATKRGVRR